MISWADRIEINRIRKCAAALKTESDDALAMARGCVAQMNTGEGKTVTAVFPSCLYALAGGGAHIATVNPYLARRDCEWMRPVYELLGFSVGAALDEARFIGMPLREAAAFSKSWELEEASVGVAAINAWHNRAAWLPVRENADAFLRYRSRAEGKRVGVIGRFAYLEKRLEPICDLYVIERQPGAKDYPDAACEYLLPEMDAVFITGSTAANKNPAAVAGVVKTCVYGGLRPVQAVEFSLDGGETWTAYETKNATADKWVYWHFGFTPRMEGSYQLSVRARTASGKVSTLAASVTFDVAQQQESQKI